MSEDESKFSDVEGIENDEEYADLKPSLLNDNESLGVRPMFITGITANQIVNRDHSFNWTLNTDGRHNAFLELITNGTRFWYEHFDMIDGRSVNTQRVMLNAPAAVQLNHKWDKDNDTSGWHHLYYYASDLPVIDNKSTFTNEVTGSGGASSLVSAWVHNGNGISLDVTPTNSRWSLRLFSSVPPGTYEIVILQRVSGYDQRYSARKTITYLAAPKISTPKEGEVVKLNAAMSVTGTWGAPNRHIQLTNAGGSSELGSDPANSRGEWAISFNAKDRYPSGGPTELNVRHIDSGNAAWTKLNIFLLAPPTLTTTASEVEMSTTIEGAGHTGSEFFVNVFLDGSTNPIGGGPVTNARWSAAVRFSTPGPHSVTAEQIYGSVRSDRGTSRLYLVRPLLPTLAVESVGEDIFLSGTGYKGVDTKVHINIHYVDDNFLTPLVDDKGGWMIKVPATLVPNNYEFSCRQSVPDGGTGRIYSSGWTNRIPIIVRTPVPTGMTVTVNGQRATFSGRGRQWGTHEVKIGIYNNGVALAGVPQATVQTNLTWSTTATADLAPGVYTNLTARQWVNTQWSTHSVKFSMTVASPPPEFTNPPEGVPAGQRPEISGRAWPGSFIVLKISGRPDAALTATGGTFKMTATEDWAPGTYTITATAAFGGGQPSSPRTRTFTVKTPVPTITTAANAEVDLIPVIKGTGFKNCWVVVYSSTHQELGGGLVGENREWEAELTERAPGNLIIYAVQKESRSSSNISTPTAQRTVKVRVPKSGITVPAQNGRPARTSMFTGTTTASEGTVELSINSAETSVKFTVISPDNGEPGMPGAVRIAFVRVELLLEPLQLDSVLIDDEPKSLDEPLHLCFGANHEVALKVASGNTWNGTPAGLLVNGGEFDPERILSASPEWGHEHPISTPWTITCAGIVEDKQVQRTLDVRSYYTADLFPLRTVCGHFQLDVIALQEAAYYPVIDLNQSVELRVRVESHYTKTPLANRLVIWTLKGPTLADDIVLDWQPSDENGEAGFTWTPDVEGDWEIEASVDSHYKKEDARHTFTVRALKEDPWLSASFGLDDPLNKWIWGAKTAYPNRGGNHEVTVAFPEGHALAETELALHWISEEGDTPEGLGIEFDPEREPGQPVQENGAVWRMTCENRRDSVFQFSVSCSKLLEACLRCGCGLYGRARACKGENRWQGVGVFCLQGRTGKGCSGGRHVGKCRRWH